MTDGAKVRYKSDCVIAEPEATKQEEEEADTGANQSWPQLRLEESRLTNVIKLNSYAMGKPSGRAYTYYTPERGSGR